MHIGVFDSGLGGLAILKAIKKRLPQYSYIYLGDNARAPYGDRSQDTIYEYTRQGVEFLFRNNCKLVILACNTASARALRRLQQEWLPAHYPDRHVLGVIIPLVESLTKLKKDACVAIIGTRATIGSNVYAIECLKRGASHISLTQKACPLLVPLIEEGWHTTIPARMILKCYLRPLKLKKIQTLILGCTHYTFLQKMISSIMGAQVRILDSGAIVAQSLKHYLERHGEIEATLSKDASIAFYTTDPSPRAKELAARFWGSSIDALIAQIDS